MLDTEIDAKITAPLTDLQNGLADLIADCEDRRVNTFPLEAVLKEVEAVAKHWFAVLNDAQDD